MARTTRNSKKNRAVSVDFSNVGDRFKPNEDYIGRIEEVTEEEGEKAPYFAMKIVGQGDNKGAIIYHRASTAEAALWRMKPLLDAIGVDTSGKVDLTPDTFQGNTVGFSTAETTYNGEPRLVISDFFPADGALDEGDDDGDDEDVDLDGVELPELKKLAKKLGIRAGRKDDAETLGEKILDGAESDDILEAAEELGIELGSEDEDDEDGGDAAEILDGLDNKTLKKIAGKLEIEVSRGRGAYDKAKAEMLEDEDALMEVLEEMGLAGEGDDDDEELTKDAIMGMTESELEEAIETHELEVELGDFRTLSKKRKAVVEAAEEEGLL